MNSPVDEFLVRVCKPKISLTEISGNANDTSVSGVAFCG